MLRRRVAALGSRRRGAGRVSTLNGRTILIVDDEPDLIAVTAEFFEYEGAHTRRAEGGHAALALIKAEPIDAVVSDVRMPAGNGLDLLAGLATFANPPPVTLVTGFSELSLEQAYHLGAHAVLPKPNDFPTLLAQAARMLTPREVRWAPLEPPSATPIEVSLPSLDECLADGRVVLGSHGIFVRGAGEPPRPQSVIRLRFGANLCVLVSVRWIRPRDADGLAAGWGAEIVALDAADRATWLERLGGLNPRAFIPRG